MCNFQTYVTFVTFVCNFYPEGHVTFIRKPIQLLDATFVYNFQKDL